jgi:hypothetical protein
MKERKLSILCLTESSESIEAAVPIERFAPQSRPFIFYGDGEKLIKLIMNINTRSIN